MADDPLSVTQASPTPSGPFLSPKGGPKPDPALDTDPLVQGVRPGPDGRLLGGVKLIRKVGQGGMGAVYSGYHLTLDMGVAVKVLPADLVARDPSYVERFLREARISAQISHQNLVNTKNVGHEHGVIFLVMDLVEGVSAQRLLDTRGPLPEADALRIVHEASLGLAEAHAAYFVHRDVKPDNILVRTRDGQVKLADLGLARAIEQTRVTAASDQLTVAGTALGTPLYMAPEQSEDAATVGPEADVWSMGATLYALLTGRAPFTGKSLPALLQAIREQPAPDLGALRSDVTPATRALVARCLDKSPNKRPSNAGVLAEELAAIRVMVTKPRLAVTSSEVSHAAQPPALSQGQSTFLEPRKPASAGEPKKPAASPTSPGGARSDAAVIATSASLVAVGFVSFAIAAAILAVHFTSSETPPVAVASSASPSPAPTATASPSPQALDPTPAPAASPSPSREPSPPPPPDPSPSPVAPQPPPPAPPTPAPPPPPAVTATVAVADLPIDQRTWDGHGWRRNKNGHVHSKSAKGKSTCGHPWDAANRRWAFDAYEPRLYDYDNIPDAVRASSKGAGEGGIYDYDGKTWFLFQHTHDDRCAHELTGDPLTGQRYVLRAPDR